MPDSAKAPAVEQPSKKQAAAEKDQEEDIAEQVVGIAETGVDGIYGHGDSGLRDPDCTVQKAVEEEGENSAGKTDAECRALYVGMTRAKNNLYIHTNTVLFDKYRINGIEHVVDGAEYGEPTEIMLQTTHKDVVLDFFKNKKEIIFNLRCGTKLMLDDVYLVAELNGRDVRVAKLSKSFVETVEKLKEKGYFTKSSEIRFIVAWKGEDDTEETPIILADIYFEKSKLV